jgi:RNA polymerase sigma-70 factor (ECF subfamily)
MVVQAVVDLTSEAAGADDLEPFLVRYRETLPAVWQYLARVTAGDRALAEDLTQDVYSAALTAWRGGRRDQVVAPWLVTVARNKFVDTLRRQEREARALALVEADEEVDAHDAAFAVSREELADLVRGLPPLQRAALALRYVDDLSLAEIAAALDRTVPAVDSLLRRARVALRRLAEEHLR